MTTTTYEGKETSADGKVHDIRRVTCGCGKVLSEMHYDCCGYSACGFGTTVHTCEPT